MSPHEAGWGFREYDCIREAGLTAREIAVALRTSWPGLWAWRNEGTRPPFDPEVLVLLYQIIERRDKMGYDMSRTGVWWHTSTEELDGMAPREMFRRDPQRLLDSIGPASVLSPQLAFAHT